jgi:hypothetical protein
VGTLFSCLEGAILGCRVATASAHLVTQACDGRGVGISHDCNIRMHIHSSLRIRPN